MARENTRHANVVHSLKTAYQNITTTEGNNRNKRPIYTGCLFYRSIFRIERPTSARAYRSLLRCLGRGSTARNLLCMVWASFKLQMTNCHIIVLDGRACNTGHYSRYS